jgi:hypothetical protein
MFRYVSTHVDLNVSLANGEAVFFTPSTPTRPSNDDNEIRALDLRLEVFLSQRQLERISEPLAPHPTFSPGESYSVTLKLYIYARFFVSPPSSNTRIDFRFFFSRYVSAHATLNASPANSHRQHSTTHLSSRYTTPSAPL